MKKYIILIFCFFLCYSALSQTEDDSVHYNEGIYLLSKAKTSENFLEAAFYFDSLTKKFPGHWLAPYYTGLSYIMASQKALDSKYKEDLLNRAQASIDNTSALKPGEPELYILQAFLYQSRLMINPQERALSFSQKAEALLKKALGDDPENPRAYFLRANNIYHTPPVLKGGPKNALPVFLKAKEKYRNYKSSLSFMPTWGEKENDEMIRMCRNAH